MGETKGIAIRLDKELYSRIENHELPTHVLINRAVSRFLEEIDPDTNGDRDELSDEIYSEVYSALYNSEINPLQQRIKYQERMIDVLKNQVEELKEDKKYLQNQLNAQLHYFSSKSSLFEKIQNKIFQLMKK